MSGRDQRPEHAQGGDMLIRCVGCRAERVIGPGWVNLPACRDCGGPMLPLDLEAAAYRRGRRDAVREIVERLRWDADVAASGPGRFGELSARFGACADWIEREFGGAGSKRVPSTSKDLEPGEAPTTGGDDEHVEPPEDLYRELPENGSPFRGTWTIYVCPDCGWWSDSGAVGCPTHARSEPVEVAPTTGREA